MAPDRRAVRIDDIEFEYEQPLVSIDHEARTVEHELLNDSVVIQHMGTRPAEISIQGVCTDSEVAAIRALPSKGTVSLRSEAHSSDVIVLRVSIDPIDPMAIDSDSNYLFDFSINAVEVTQPGAAPGVGSGMGQSVYDGTSVWRGPVGGDPTDPQP